MQRKPYVYFLRGGAIFIIAYLLFKLSLVSLLWISAPGDSVFHDLPLWALYLVAVLVFLFLFNSLCNFFTLYDRTARDAALMTGRGDGTFAELRTVLSSPIFIIETVTACILVTVFSLCSGFSEIPDMIFFGREVSPGFKICLPFLLLLPLCFLISAFARYEVRRYWFYLDLTRNLDVLDSKVRFIAKLLFILIGYPTIFPFVPLLAYVAFTFISIFVQLSVLLSVAGVIMAITLFLLTIIVISYALSMNKRKKFIRSLLQICEEKGYEITEIKHPYRSFFRQYEGESFLLRRGDECYSCKLIPSVRRRVPLYLSSDRHGYFLHRFGFKNHHVSLNHNIIWGHDSPHRKITVINPMPKQVIAIAQNGTTRPLAPSDKVWDTIIYDDKTFLGVIDRDCLGRANTPY